MRCFFIKGGHVAGVEELPDVTECVAIEMARLLFEEREAEFDGFEVWDCDREIYEFSGLKASA